MKKKTTRCSGRNMLAGSRQGNNAARITSANAMERTASQDGMSGRRAKALTKLSKYSVSGATHSSGAEAMSVLMWPVTASRRADGDRAIRQPARPTAPGWSCDRCRWNWCLVPGETAPHAGTAPDDTSGQGGEAERPRERLPSRPDQGLDHEHERKQDGDAAEIARGVQEIGIGCVRVACAGKPALDQRRRGGDGEERRADGDDKQAQEPQRGRRARVRSPTLGDTDRQGDSRRAKQAEMREALAARSKVASQQMRVAVSA